MAQRRFIHRSAHGWEGVERDGYVPGEVSRVVRNTLIGARKVAPDAPGPALEVRYFEVPPGGATRLEKHEHEHFVIVGEGAGHAIVGTTVREVHQHDVVYVAPMEPHQFLNRSAEPFGFYCIVTAHRDLSQRLDPEELARLDASPAGPFIDRSSASPSSPAER